MKYVSLSYNQITTALICRDIERSFLKEQLLRLELKNSVNSLLIGRRLLSYQSIITPGTNTDLIKDISTTVIIKLHPHKRLPQRLTINVYRMHFFKGRIEAVRISDFRNLMGPNNYTIRPEYYVVRLWYLP